MSLFIREVDLHSELPALTALFNRGFNVALPTDRFEWLYRQNPDGPATAWFVVDDRSGDVAGCTAVFPRRIQVRGQQRAAIAWNCGDFCIMPRYRAGAAAIKLRQAARDGVDAGVSPFLYAHPNDRMLQIHLRVGHQPLGRMIRLARPTRVTGKGILHRLATSGLRVARPERLLPRDEYQIEHHALPPELDDLFDRLSPSLGTLLVRDVKYLRWRFLACPLVEYRLVIAARGSQLTGYLAFCFNRGQLCVRDWLGVDNRAVRTLFGAALEEACVAEANSVSVTLLETHRDVPLIRTLGFSTRPQVSTSITYAPEGLPWRDAVTSPQAWYMTVGDRDV